MIMNLKMAVESITARKDRNHLLALANVAM